MAISRKPGIETDQFIEGAKADNVKQQKRKNGKTEKRDTVKTENKPEAEKTGKKIKMTFYMPEEMYVKWKEYELRQLQQGNKTSFQGVIEEYMNKILDI